MQFIPNNETDHEREIIQHDHYIDALDFGIKLHLREKRLEHPESISADKIVLFVHGATYPSVAGFDLPVPGYSWMDFAARRGFVAYSLDIRGYGGSTRPGEMDMPALDNPPVVRAEEAVRDLLVAVDHLRSKHSVEKVNLVGWSWGTVITGWYTSFNNNKVNRLVLYAPVYSVERSDLATQLEDPSRPGQPNYKIGAYRLVGFKDTVERWDAQIKSAEKTAWREEIVLKTFFETSLKTDPAGKDQHPPVFRAPNGVLIDIYYIFSQKPVYDAHKIKIPVLVIRGADDMESTDPDARGLFDCLVNSPLKRYVVIGDATHIVNLERNRYQLFEEVQLFLGDR